MKSWKGFREIIFSVWVYSDKVSSVSVDEDIELA